MFRLLISLNLVLFLRTFVIDSLKPETYRSISGDGLVCGSSVIVSAYLYILNAVVVPANVIQKLDQLRIVMSLFFKQS